jgi:hypothetical protein
VSELDTSAPEPVLEWDTPLFRMARAQYEQALPYADVSDMVAERLCFPERAVIVSVPLRRDDGSVEVFPGYRVQHSTVLGPTKGGMRYDPEVSLGECAALATWMTWKCALLRLPYGGAKAPSSFDALMKTHSTALTRPCSESGVKTATVVPRMFMLIMSTKPAMASMARESGRERERPKTIVAAPKIATTARSVRPAG